MHDNNKLDLCQRTKNWLSSNRLSITRLDISRSTGAIPRARGFSIRSIHTGGRVTGSSARSSRDSSSVTSSPVYAQLAFRGRSSDSETKGSSTSCPVADDNLEWSKGKKKWPAHRFTALGWRSCRQSWVSRLDRFGIGCYGHRS